MGKEIKGKQRRKLGGREERVPEENGCKAGDEKTSNAWWVKKWWVRDLRINSVCQTETIGIKLIGLVKKKS